MAGAGPVASGAAALAASPVPLFGALPGAAGAAGAAAGAPKSKKRKTAVSGEGGGVLGTAGGLGAGVGAAGKRLCCHVTFLKTHHPVTAHWCLASLL